MVECVARQTSLCLTGSQARRYPWNSSPNSGGNSLISSWGDFYNPAVYKDAGIPDGYKVRKMALEHEACAAFREEASSKLVDYFLDIGLLSERPRL